MPNFKEYDKVVAGSRLKTKPSKDFGLGEDAAPGGMRRFQGSTEQSSASLGSGRVISGSRSNHVSGGVARETHALIPSREPCKPDGITQVIGGSYIGHKFSILGY